MYVAATVNLATHELIKITVHLIIVKTLSQSNTLLYSVHLQKIVRYSFIEY